jgi:hypothetical protein
MRVCEAQYHDESMTDDAHFMYSTAPNCPPFLPGYYP